MKWTAAAWDLARCGNKPGNFNKILGRMAAKTDTRTQVMKKYEKLETKLQQFSTKFSGKPLPNGDKELTTIEWGWMHTLLEAFMLRINSGKTHLARTTYQATGININHFESSKRITPDQSQHRPTNLNYARNPTSTLG